MIVSVLTGEWSMMATVTMLEQFHATFKLRQRFLTIQLIMPCVKVQTVVANEILNALNIPEEAGNPVTTGVVVNGR